MIELKDIERRWGGFTLGRINLKIEKGEYFGISGHNGAGKTLLLETIAGIWTPERGQVFIDGKDVTSSPPEKRNIGFLYQEPLLFSHLSVKENIAYPLRIKKIPRKEREKRLEEIITGLKLRDIFERKNVNLLSGGERQKVALARALASNPAALLLDEPTNSLDGQSRQLFYHIFKELNREMGITVVCVNHDYNELKSWVSRIAVVENGRIMRIE